MNRYKVSIPYSYRRYGDVTGYCNANSEDEVREEAIADFLEDEEYDEQDYAGDNDFDHSKMEVTLEEENIDGDNV
ncbi:MAG: hypothetical protein ISS16_10630 [Ignavibacteria bacterium]|nr:hypothetical protein [Ignavibacteria bacterium]